MRRQLSVSIITCVHHDELGDGSFRRRFLASDMATHLSRWMVVPELVVVVPGQPTVMSDQGVAGLAAQGVEVDGDERIRAKFNAAFQNDPALLFEHHLRLRSILGHRLP